MGMVLSVYGSSALKEYVLPAVNNTELEILLERSLFQLREDLKLRLEILDGKWYFAPMEERIHTNEIDYKKESLSNGMSFLLVSKWNEILAIMIRESISPLTVYSKYDLSQISRISIGSGLGKEICYSAFYGGDQIISEEHAVLCKTQTGWELEDHSKNGTFVNDLRIFTKKILEFGDQINIWGLRMLYLGDVLAINETEAMKLDLQVFKKIKAPNGTTEQTGNSDSFPVLYHRSPRNMERLETEAIEIEAPPAVQEEQTTPVFMLIGPALTMMLPMMLSTGFSIINTKMSGQANSSYLYTGLITAVSSGFFGVFWSINNMRFAKEQARKNEIRRFDAYSEYLLKCSEKVHEKYMKSIQILKERYPFVEQVISYDDTIPENLWGRNKSHPDFLYQRIGIGDRPFQIEIQIPKERFTMLQDSLADKPKFIRENHKILHEVPVGVDLAKHTLIGIIGGTEKKGAYQIVYNLVSQIATQNCYTEVKMGFLAGKDGQNKKKWDFARWLPHVWSQDRKSRYLALEASEINEVCYELTQILRQRSEFLKENNNRDFRFSPHYVLFVESMGLLKGELINRYLFDPNQNLGFTTILMEERYADLPNSCEYIIQNDSEYQGIFHVADGRNNGVRVSYDEMNAEALNCLSKKLANYKVNEIELGGELPKAVTFFEMYGVDKLEEFYVLNRWKKNRTYESMKALIGLKAGGQLCYLDLHEKYHGPHGLLAGTTGSGKSETLQTYMLSLALNFSPDDIGYFIIDYKGGGMGNLFSGLPHVLGQISNLSGNQIQRAMVSIKSENMRRQRAFNENGVNNINAYTRLYKSGEVKTPIPHLFIIIDEFAELMREQPDFMKELISVAQVGRSLGTHLILATQKPAGVVDDNIWSNSKFRICLRVQERQDSMEMLHKPDAAYITQTGRGYLQVGNDEIFEQFQSGWSGAVYDKGHTIKQQTTVQLLTNTGKTGFSGNYLKIKAKEEKKRKWFSLLYRIMEQTEEEEITICYERLKQNGTEISENDHNLKLLKNFKKLYLEVRALLPEMSDENYVEQHCKWILEASEQRNIKLPEAKEKTQLEVLIEYLAMAAAQNGYQKQCPLWLPVLPEKIQLTALDGYEKEIFQNGRWKELETPWELKVMVGLCDDPVNRRQMPLMLNFMEDGNHAVCGVNMSGKSTFLQTAVFALIQKYSPEAVNLYLLDFSSHMLAPFEKDAHIGGILTENNLDTIGKFFYLLEQMLEERKKAFRGGNYDQYVRKYGLVYPAIIVVIDNIANFREKTGEQYDDVLSRISKECVANGIYLLISCAGFGMNETPRGLHDNIQKVVSLEMQDVYAYGDVLRVSPIKIVPDPGIAGRGLAEVDGSLLEFQACVALSAQDDYERMESIQRLCNEMSLCYSGRRARPIPYIPEKPVWSEFQNLTSMQEMNEQRDKLTVGYDLRTASIAGINLRRIYCYLISGKARSGKTNLMKILIRSAVQKKSSKVVIVEFENTELKKEAREQGIEYISNIEQYLTFMQESLIPEFVERNKRKKVCKEQGMEEDEIFAALSQYRPYFIFFADLTEYSQMVHSDAGHQNNIDGAMTNFLEKGSMLNIYFFATFNWEKRLNVLGQNVYESFIRYKTGIHLGGNTDSQRVLEFSSLSYREASTAEKPGYGWMTSEDSSEELHIVVPFAKG